jgi:hypothetical protein
LTFTQASLLTWQVTGIASFRDDALEAHLSNLALNVRRRERANIARRETASR